ncbi:MAG: hypothetical protein KDN22_25060 [Verrucomicrobiae bacterium]|nr:hypothetical protein [Verrucomicrobiae bacterium]
MQDFEQSSLAFHEESPPPGKAGDTGEPTYVLCTLEVFNWGPFSGLHRADIDPRGTAIIGPTGSGKTTLIDALMTLLVAQPRYNLASTGGHESDRTLISYVRGVLGGDGSSGGEEVARPGKTLTGICATYQGGDVTLRVGGILWTDGPSNATQDLKRRWFFSQADDESLEKWLQLVHDDGVRDLMRHGRETGKLRIFDSKKAYLVHARKFFAVGENAFTLLNRAAGLKQLNSIDEIFRDLVLDDRTAFDRAQEVAGEFDNLAGIHTELETARRQQESLVPVAEENRKLEKSRTRAEQWRQLKRIVPIWFAREAEKKWAAVAADLARQLEEKTAQQRSEEQSEMACESRVDTLRERYLELGGNVIGELEKTITAQEERVAERRKHAEDYRQFIRPFGLDEELSAAALQRNQAVLAGHREAIQTKRDRRHEETLAAHSRLRDEETRAEEVESALRKVRDRPGSNIPPKFQDFRAELARQLGLVDDELPFVAELVEVKPEESGWRGAIERAIGSERLRILVPDSRLDAALRWVNDRDNRLHVRLQRARQDAQPAEFFSDGFLRKLNFKPHPLCDAAKDVLAGADRHCVASPEALRLTEHGMTIEGMMSGRRGKFEKQDQRRLGENWMTGFDNKDQLHALARELEALRQGVAQWRETTRQYQSELTALDGQLRIIDELGKLDFATIDLPGAELDLNSSRDRLASMLDPNSDASQAKVAFERERQELASIQQRLKQLIGELGRLDEKHRRAEAKRAEAAQRAAAGMSDDEVALAEKKLPIAAALEAEQFEAEERSTARMVEETLEKQQERVIDHEQRLIRLMAAAQRVDTGALAESGTDIDDVADYLERLRVLNEEALPEKLHRFLEYLNRSSDQGVTQLLAGIAEEVDGIEHRIADLNHTLAKVDFRSGRYLQLQPQRIKHERLRSLETAQRKLRSAALKDDQGESHYRALREVIEILRDAGDNRRQQGSRALLDPRYRLQFFVVEVDRLTGDRSPPRTGSQSGSGGEKELMASHILTASLSYALCPAEASRPLYGTVVLDEAFSKSSPSAAGRIIEALRIFSLHPIFVTPNKEIGLLKRHTHKVICVQRPNKQASLASISWEELDELARRKG